MAVLELLAGAARARIVAARSRQSYRERRFTQSLL